MDEQGAAVSYGGELESGRARVAVLGPGGVGGLLAALLARAGSDVVCLAGSTTAEALRTRGVSLRSERYGTFTVPVRAEERLNEPPDVCLVTVKATHLDAALERVPSTVLGDALLIPLLNGVEHVALLRDRYPGASVVPAAIRVESTRTRPGEVVHDSPFANVVLASGDAAVEARVRDVARLLEQAGLDVEVADHEAGVLWGKLAFLAPLALLTTHAQAPVGVVRRQRRDDLEALVAESAAVARAEGAAAEEAATLALFDKIPASMQSSMQRDAAAGRPLELEAIGGAVLRAAQRHQLPAPVTARLVQELRQRDPLAAGP